MNYFAQGIQQGGEAGARGYLERKKREQDDRLNKARLDFEANQLRENFKGQGDLLTARQKFEGEQAGLGRKFTGGQNALNRTHGTTEREAGQRFQSGERSQDRTLTSSMALENRLAEDARDMTRQLSDSRKLRENQRQFDEGLAFQKDPNNPENQLRAARTAQVESDLGGFGTPGTPKIAPVPTALTGVKPPAAAIELLRKNPSMAPQFRAKYGIDPAQYLTN